jgi:hypothetical protein
VSRPKLLDLAAGTVKLDEADYVRLAGRTVYIGTNGYAYFSTHATGPRTLHDFVVGDRSPGMHIDHVNGDKLDNRSANLRVVTPQRNQVNRKRLNRNNSSGVRGVGLTRTSARNPWRAQITVNRQNIHLGLFPTREQAIAARRAAEETYFGEVCP